MKTLFVLILFAGLGLAQTTSQVCFVTDKTKPAKSVCQDIPPALRNALLSFIAAQTTTVNGVTTPNYAGIGDLILDNLSKGLFPSILAQYPPAAVQTKLDAAATAQAAIDTAKATVIVKPVPAADPQ